MTPALVLMTTTALFASSGAQPEMFGLVPVDSIVSPPETEEGGGYSTHDMDHLKGWRPTAYSVHVLRELFGEPQQLSPEFRGWAFAMHDWPEFGVMLVPRSDGLAWPVCWDWGYGAWGERFDAERQAKFAYSAWLNALAALHRDIARAEAP